MWVLLSLALFLFLISNKALNSPRFCSHPPAQQLCASMLSSWWKSPKFLSSPIPSLGLIFSPLCLDALLLAPQTSLGQNQACLIHLLWSCHYCICAPRLETKSGIYIWFSLSSVSFLPVQSIILIFSNYHFTFPFPCVVLPFFSGLHSLSWTLRCPPNWNLDSDLLHSSLFSS